MKIYSYWKKSIAVMTLMPFYKRRIVKYWVFVWNLKILKAQLCSEYIITLTIIFFLLLCLKWINTNQYNAVVTYFSSEILYLCTYNLKSVAQRSKERGEKFGIYLQLMRTFALFWYQKPALKELILSKLLRLYNS